MRGAEPRKAPRWHLKWTHTPPTPEHARRHYRHRTEPELALKVHQMCSLVQLFQAKTLTQMYSYLCVCVCAYGLVGAANVFRLSCWLTFSSQLFMFSLFQRSHLACQINSSLSISNSTHFFSSLCLVFSCFAASV